MNVAREINRTLRFANRLAVLTGNRDAAVGMNADEIATAIADARRALIDACLGEARTINATAKRLSRSRLFVRLPTLRQLTDEALVAYRADLRRKAHEARQAEHQGNVEARRGIRPVQRSKPTPVHDPVAEKLREIRRAHERSVAHALAIGLGGLCLVDAAK